MSCIIGGYVKYYEDTALDNNTETGTIVTVLKIYEIMGCEYSL